MLTAFHTTKRNPKSKALNAVLESVWVMPPSIMHHNEFPQKGDEAENHSTAFGAEPCARSALSAGGAMLCPQPWDWKGRELPFPSCLSSSSPPPSTVRSISSPVSLLQDAVLLPSLHRSFQNFDIPAALLGAALKSIKFPTVLQESAAFSCVQAALCPVPDGALGF